MWFPLAHEFNTSTAESIRGARLMHIRIYVTLVIVMHFRVIIFGCICRLLDDTHIQKCVYVVVCFICSFPQLNFFDLQNDQAITHRFKNQPSKFSTPVIALVNALWSFTGMMLALNSFFIFNTNLYSFAGDASHMSHPFKILHVHI